MGILTNIWNFSRLFPSASWYDVYSRHRLRTCNVALSSMDSCLQLVSGWSGRACSTGLSCWEQGCRQDGWGRPSTWGVCISPSLCFAFSGSSLWLRLGPPEEMLSSLSLSPYSPTLQVFFYFSAPIIKGHFVEGDRLSIFFELGSHPPPACLVSLLWESGLHSCLDLHRNLGAGPAPPQFFRLMFSTEWHWSLKAGDSDKWWEFYLQRTTDTC